MLKKSITFATFATISFLFCVMFIYREIWYTPKQYRLAIQGIGIIVPCAILSLFIAQKNRSLARIMAIVYFPTGDVISAFVTSIFTAKRFDLLSVFSAQFLVAIFLSFIYLVALVVAQNLTRSAPQYL